MRTCVRERVVFPVHSECSAGNKCSKHMSYHLPKCVLSFQFSCWIVCRLLILAIKASCTGGFSHICASACVWLVRTRANCCDFSFVCASALWYFHSNIYLYLTHLCFWCVYQTDVLSFVFDTSINCSDSWLITRVRQLTIGIQQAFKFNFIDEVAFLK